MSARYCVTIERLCPHAAIARVHEGDSAVLGVTPYVWSCTIQTSGTMATLKGVCQPLPNAATRPLSDALYREGFRYRIHTRMVDGRPRDVLKPIRPPRPAPMFLPSTPIGAPS